MHAEAFRWVQDHAPRDAGVVLDIGGRNINGTVRSLFPFAHTYVALDIAEGPEVDIVADAATWTPDRAYEVVVCCEVFEHTAVWPGICQTAFKACRAGGLFIATMAGPGRRPHSGIDGGWHLHAGEHYANVEPDDLRRVLIAAGFTDVTVDQQSADVRAVATKPTEGR